MTILAPIQPRDLRDAFRLSRERLARRPGVSGQTVERWAPRAPFPLWRSGRARLLGVSAKTVERWEARPTRPARDETRARMAKLREIADLAAAVYTPERLADFLDAPIAEFGGL